MWIRFSASSFFEYKRTINTLEAFAKHLSTKASECASTPHGRERFPDVFNQWEELTRSATDGKYVFEKKYGRKTYRLVCEKGGKNNLVGGKRLIRMTTFYEVTNHKQEREERRRKKRK